MLPAVLHPCLGSALITRASRSLSLPTATGIYSEKPETLHHHLVYYRVY